MGFPGFMGRITSAAGRIKLSPRRSNVHLFSNISRFKSFTFVLVNGNLYASLQQVDFILPLCFLPGAKICTSLAAVRPRRLFN